MLRLAEPARAFKPIRDSMVEEIEVPERWAPEQPLTDRLALAGQVAGTNLPAGSYLQEGMLVAEPDLGPDERELAILVSADTGVAGKVQPGDFVDIEATFVDDNTDVRVSQVIVPAARVIEVGLPRSQQEEAPAGGLSENEVVPVTFALTVRESLIVTYAESFAEEVRLALLPAGETRSKAGGSKFQLEVSP